jgi:HSP20 family protein
MTLVQFTNGSKNGKHSYANTFDSLFNVDPLFSKSTVSLVPAVNFAEGDTEYFIELAVPGLKKEDFKISLDQDRLLVSAEYKADSELKKYNRREFNYKSFSRTFILPDNADENNIQAEYRDGILLISLGRKEDPKNQSREISIK